MVFSVPLTEKSFFRALSLLGCYGPVAGGLQVLTLLGCNGPVAGGLQVLTLSRCVTLRKKKGKKNAHSHTPLPLKSGNKKMCRIPRSSPSACRHCPPFSQALMEEF